MIKTYKVFTILPEDIKTSICVNNYYSYNRQCTKKPVILKSISLLKNRISDCTYLGWKTWGLIPCILANEGFKSTMAGGTYIFHQIVMKGHGSYYGLFNNWLTDCWDLCNLLLNTCLLKTLSVLVGTVLGLSNSVKNI